MRKIALNLSILGGLAAIIGGLLVATHAVPHAMSTLVVGLVVGGKILLALAGIAAVALAARSPTLAALLQIGIAFVIFGVSPNAQVAIAWLPAMALVTASAMLLLCTVPREHWSLFGVARGVGTLLAAFFLFMGIGELAAGLGPSGHFLKDLLQFWPTYPLTIGPLLGWLGRRWAAVGGVLLLGEFLWFVSMALGSGDPGGAWGWGGALLFDGLWALVGMVYLWEWWRHRPHPQPHAGTGNPRAAAH